MKTDQACTHIVSNKIGWDVGGLAGGGGTDAGTCAFLPIFLARSDVGGGCHGDNQAIFRQVTFKNDYLDGA